MQATSEPNEMNHKNYNVYRPFTRENSFFGLEKSPTFTNSAKPTTLEPSSISNLPDRSSTQTYRPSFNQHKSYVNSRKNFEIPAYLNPQ